MKCIVCLQTVWVGTLAVDTKQRGLRWQQCSMFLCHSQLCTAVLVCAREEERTCQRITEESPSISPSEDTAPPHNIQFSIFPKIAAFIHAFYTLNLAAYPAISATQCRQHSVQYNWHLNTETSFPGQHLVCTLFSSQCSSSPDEEIETSAINCVKIKIPLWLSSCHSVSFSPELKFCTWIMSSAGDTQARWWRGCWDSWGLGCWAWWWFLSGCWWEKLGLVPICWLKNTWSPQRDRNKVTLNDVQWKSTADSSTQQV